MHCSGCSRYPLATSTAQTKIRWPWPSFPISPLLCCFISSLADSGQGSDANIHLQHAISHFNAQVSPHNSITVEAVLASPPSQKALSKRLDSHIFQSLLFCSSPVNKARILSISAPQAGTWLSVVPSPGLDLHPDIQVNVRW